MKKCITNVIIFVFLGITPHMSFAQQNSETEITSLEDLERASSVK